MSKIALIVVRDGTGIAALAKRLVEAFGFELRANEVALEAIASSGLRATAIGEEQAKQLVAEPGSVVELVVANFLSVEAAGRDFLSWKRALAGFDRGIVGLIREVAWRPDKMAVIGDPADFDRLDKHLESNSGALKRAFCLEASIKALRAASSFEIAVASYLEIHGAEVPDLSALSGYPKALHLSWPRAHTLASGENAQQQAALYGSFGEHFEQMAGGALSYQDVLTISKAAYLIGEFERPACALLSNGKILDLQCGDDFEHSMARLLEIARPSHGTWLVANGTVSQEMLNTISSKMISGMLLPDIEQSYAKAAVERGVEKLVVSRTGLGYEALQEVQSVVGGVLVQDKDRSAINPMEWKVCSLAQPLVEDWESLLVGARLARHLDSTACVCLRGGRVVGFSQGSCEPSEAWGLLKNECSDLEGTLVVFDVPVASSSLVKDLKDTGVRVALCPLAAESEGMVGAANEVGLTLMSMPRTLRRL